MSTSLPPGTYPPSQPPTYPPTIITPIEAPPNVVHVNPDPQPDQITSITDPAPPPRNGCMSWTAFKNFRYHWIDTLVTIALWVVAMVFSYAVEPYNRYFTERDPSLSYPHNNSEEIPTWLLFVLCLAVPSLVLFLSQAVLRWRFSHAKRTHRIAEFFLAQGVLFQALGLSFFVTASLKLFFGRHRPNFYAYCNYKGFADAMASGDYTEYNALTMSGAVGDIKYCRNTNIQNLRDSRLSHPSAHASLTFAGMGFLGIFLYHMLLSHRPTRRNHFWKAIVFILPLFVAGIVAATRTRDYWHNFDDTILGMIIGLGAAGIVFHINYSSKTTHNVGYIGDLFPQNRARDVSDTASVTSVNSVEDYRGKRGVGGANV